MGRKKKKTSKPWCWYCNREFEDEKILLQHQKAKHFKCHICHKKLYTGPGLQIHCMQVHKENIDRVPNAIKGRDDINLEICGMENIPAQDLIEHEKQKALQSGQSKDEYLDSDSEDSQPPPPPPKTIPPPPPIQQPPPPPGVPPIMMGYPPPPGVPGVPPMMIPPGYPPHMMGLMGMNPMMMYPPIPQSLPQQQPTPAPIKSQSKPPPLMSLTPQPLMGTQVSPAIGPPQASIQPSLKPPLFPSVPPILNQAPPPPPQLPVVQQPQHQQNILESIKIEKLASGSVLIHPEYDISLEEYRASLPKYKAQQPFKSHNGSIRY